MTDYRVQMIRSARLRLGEVPRNLDKSDSYLRVRKPPLAFGIASGQKAAYKRFEALLERGRVVWGSAVVADQSLFSEGKHDGWAAVIYSPKIHIHDNLDGVAETSQVVNSLRNKSKLEPEEMVLGDKLNNTQDWFPPEDLPKSINPSQDLKISSALVVRKHLPMQLLFSGWLPILTHEEIHGIAILPERFWTPDMKSTWLSR